MKPDFKKMSRSVSRSSGAKKGEDWKSQIYFDPEAAERKDNIVSVTDEQLLTKLATLVGEDEDIIEISLQKCPLASWLCSMGLFYHMFNVFKTEAWWWSIEKNSEGITVQRSKIMCNVKDNYRQKDRLRSVKLIESDEGRTTVLNMIRWLYKESELDNTYNYLTSNCKHFANAVFNYVTKNGKQKLSWQYHVYFDPEVKIETIRDFKYFITDDKLLARLEVFVKEKERIQSVSLYKYSLSWMSVPDMFYGDYFILIKTKTYGHSYWWSIEMRANDITIQRSLSRDHVRNTHRRANRTNIREHKSVEGKKSVYKLIDWLYKNKHLNKRLNYKKMTSQKFSKMVFKYVAASKVDT